MVDYRTGHRVLICDIKDPAEAVASLKAKYGQDAKIYGEVCDVSDAASVRALAKSAKAQLKTVDYWINNAALNGGRKPFLDVSDEAIEAVVKVNMFGVLICTKVAMELMLDQARGRRSGSRRRRGSRPGSSVIVGSSRVDAAAPDLDRPRIATNRSAP